MGILIIYETKYGSTKEAATLLGEVIGNSVVKSIDDVLECDLDHEVIIFGCHVRGFKMSPKTFYLIEKYQEVLKGKQLFSYIMTLEGDMGKKYLQPIHHILGDSLKMMQSFGGRLNLKALSVEDYYALKHEMQNILVPFSDKDLFDEEKIRKFGMEVENMIYDQRIQTTNKKQDIKLDDDMIIAQAEIFLRTHRVCVVAANDPSGISQQPVDYLYHDYCLYLISSKHNPVAMNLNKKNVSILIFNPYELTLPKTEMHISGIIRELSPVDSDYQNALFLCGVGPDFNQYQPVHLYKVSIKELTFIYPGFQAYHLPLSQTITFSEES